MPSHVLESTGYLADTTTYIYRIFPTLLKFRGTTITLAILPAIGTPPLPQQIADKVTLPSNGNLLIIQQLA
ncbi:hypothetical protein V498_01530 [Pseudogymnoascus sp. VKM F-4517 (FW-2822)]|nr:hypothetical protein V498_01530 [Pseudogymnoascus sp. VKM F-4517 (FW-2822)]